MRCARSALLLSCIVAGTVVAQGNPQLAVEASLGKGGHTYSTARDTFTTPDAQINRLSAAFRIGAERAFNPYLVLESSIGNGANTTNGVGASCFVAKCPKAFPGPSGIGLGMEGRGTVYNRLTLSAGGGAGMLPHFTKFVDASLAVRAVGSVALFVDMRHLWTESDSQQHVVFHPLSFGVRYLHRGDQ